MTLFFIVFSVFGFCLVAMAVGLIIRNKGFTTCGRAAAAIREGESGGCSVCGAGSGGSCKREKTGE
ncbi:MAG TPA: hypothetical protein PKE55_06800 [Kiritimatiellia bacterium]|nr:hypothetical protein [Kiritimatiellia bacterium]